MPQQASRLRLTTCNDTVRRAILPPLVSLSLLVGLLLWLVSSLASAARWVEHSDAVVGQAQRILGLMVDAETGQRGYLVGGESLFLEPYQKAQASLPSAFDTLAGLVSDNPDQAARVHNLRVAYDTWNANAHEEMAPMQGGGQARIARFNKARGKR